MLQTIVSTSTKVHFFDTYQFSPKWGAIMVLIVITPILFSAEIVANGRGGQSNRKMRRAANQVNVECSE